MHGKILLSSALAALVLVLPACNKSVETPPPGAVATPATTATRGADGAQNKLAKILSSDNIGRRIDIFERTAGAPTDATADSSTYDLDGCTVTVETKDKAVNWISLQLDNPKCTADLEPLIQTKRVVTASKPLTYGELEQLMQREAEYKAPCLGMSCGNAFEPFFEAIFPGFHANNFIEIVAASLLSNSGTEKQGDAWIAELTKAAGEDFMTDNKVACDRAYDNLARGALATATVDSIGFGHRDDPYQQDCN